MDDLNNRDLTQLAKSADRAADLLKALANRNRLTVLCLLSQGECSVSDLEAFLGIRQPTLSQQLVVLREENLVAVRRDGKTIDYSPASPDDYSPASPEAHHVIGLLCVSASQQLPRQPAVIYPPGRRRPSFIS